MKINNLEIIKGFGNTDCKSKCNSHLLYLGDIEIENAIEKVIETFKKIGLKPSVIK
jgi:Uri superfamily endonuclease